MLSNDSENIMPSDYRLHSNYPNPFNPSTIITYDLAADGHVDLSIYNIIGKKVKTIVNQNETAGRKFTAWYGTDDVGNALSAGMYFYRLTAGGKVFTKKMVLMK
jgi:flagellar hook assembly protein FlgD